MTNWKPTPEQIDAAIDKQESMNAIYAIGMLDDVEDRGDYTPAEIMSAALTAAHDAAPEPDTTEFEAALHRLASRAIAYGRGAAEHDAVDVPFQRLIDMYKERR